VIFDCDCVLVDSERRTVAVEARMLTEMGWPITVDEVVRQFVGGSSDTMLAEIERHLGPGPPPSSTVVRPRGSSPPSTPDSSPSTACAN